MRMTRRAVLAGGAAALAVPRGARAQEGVPVLAARPGAVQLAPAGYRATEIWGYGGAVPGPEIRLAQGARLRRRFENGLPQDSSVHWHGIRIANAMDGVPGMTQPVVPAGASFDYDFAVPDAGTYWYHPHNRTMEQMARGLYGALIVEEPEGARPDIDAEHVLMLDDWRLTQDAQIAGGFGGLHDAAHGGRLGNWITVNGDGAWARPARRHDRLRLRLINCANARIFALEAQGLAGWVVALDGMPLQTPLPLEELVLAPSQRADLLVDVMAERGAEAFLLSRERDGGYALATFDVGAPGRTGRRAAPAPLPAADVPLPELADAATATLLMEGGAMGRMDGALLGAERLGPRALAQRGMVWAMDGRAGMPEAPLLDVLQGQTVRIAIANDTAWPHAMHLHGHHFRRVGADGTLGPLRDTLLVQRGEVADIAFVADNPGDWLLHCHMLEHAAAGMMTWLRVS